MLFNSPVLKNALIASVNRDIALDPALLPILQGPLVSDNNDVLIAQAIFKTLCSDTERPIQDSYAITAAYSEGKQMYGGVSEYEIRDIFTGRLRMIPERDFKIVFKHNNDDARCNDNLFKDAAIYDAHFAAAWSSIAADDEYVYDEYVLLGAFLVFMNEGATDLHIITCVNFRDKSKNFIFDSETAQQEYYDWVNQPSTGVLAPVAKFRSIAYVCVHKDFYYANIVRSEDNRCRHKFIPVSASRK
jgi:hypothetical protein